MLCALLGSYHVAPRYSHIVEKYGKILYISLGAQILEHESKFKQCYQWL